MPVSALIKPMATVVICISMMATTGCARLLLGERSMNPNPLENPQMNITSFTDALECMDQLMIDYDVPQLTLTAQDLSNKTGDGEPLVGAKEMLITSLSKISERSQRIRFVSYGTDQRDILLLHKAHTLKDDFITPDYFIRGGITQLDKNVFASRFGGALNDDDWNAAFTSGQGVSYAAMDMNVGLVSNLQIIPGVHSSNVLAIYDRGAGTDLGGRLNSVGTFFDFGIDRRDGIGQAIRNMVDLGVIELVGKLTHVPYMSCLRLDTNHPKIAKMIHNTYLKDRENQVLLIRIVQARLRQLQYYSGPIDGELNQATLNAIEYFRHLYQVPKATPADLVNDRGTYLVDFHLYKAILYQPKYVEPEKQRPANPAPLPSYAPTRINVYN